VEIIKWGILLTLVLPVPFVLGLIPVRYMNSSQRTPAMTYVCGWFVSFFVFEVTAVPFILMEMSFTLLVAVYSCIVALLLIVSLWIGRGVWKDYAENFKNVKTMPWYVKLGWIVAFLLIACQMIYAVRHEYYDGDDAYYIATSVVAKTFDSMYLRDAYTGYLYPLDTRHAFSPTPIYQAWLSKLSHIAPAVVAHSVLAPVWLMFMYCIYGQIGNRLMSKHKNYRPVFMIFLAVWFVFGNVSIYTSETFAITRTWQGKGLMAGMVIPALYLCLIYMVQEKVSQGMWMLLICVCLSAVLATSVSFMLIPTIVGLSAVFIGIKKRSLRFAVKMFACCIPCLILGICYIVIK
jgi:hypothetical protein